MADVKKVHILTINRTDPNYIDQSTVIGVLENLDDALECLKDEARCYAKKWGGKAVKHPVFANSMYVREGLCGKLLAVLRVDSDILL